MLKLATLIFAQTISVRALQATIFANPATTNTTSTLFVMLNIALTIPANSSIRIKYPTLLAIDTVCSVVDPASLVISSCLPSGSQIEIKFPNDLTGNIYLQFNKFTTPLTTTYTGFTIQTFDASGVILEQIDSVKLNSLQPKSMSATIIQDSTRMGSITKFNLTATPKSQCSTCAIEITGPGLSVASCVNCTAIPFGLRIQQSLIFGKTYSFTIANCTNPSSLAATYQVNIVDTLNGGLAELIYINVIAPDPALLTNLSAVIIGQTELKKLTSISVSFNVPLQLEINCSIDVQIPPDFTDLKLYLQQVQTQGVFSTQGRSLPFTVMDANLVRIQDACLIQTLAGQAQFQFSFIRNPGIVKPTGSFKITINDANLKTVCLSTDVLSISNFTTSSIASFKSNFTNPKIQSISNAIFEIIPTNNLYSSSFIIIQLPLEFYNTQNVTCTSLNIVSATQSPNCSVSGKYLNISALFYSSGYNPITDQSIKIQVNGIGTTPDYVTPLQFIVSTFASFGQPVDNSTFILSGLLLPGTLQPSYLFSIDQTSAYPIQLTLNLTLQSKVGNGSIILLTLPSEISINAAPYCSVILGFTSNCTLSLISQNVVQLIGLGAKPAGTKITLKIGDLRLPRYQGTLSTSLNITTLTNSSYIVDTSSLNLTVTKSTPISQIQLLPASYQNSAQTSLNIIIQVNQTFQLGDLLVIQLPIQMQLLAQQYVFTQNNTIVINATSQVSVQIQNPISFQSLTGFNISYVDQNFRTIANSNLNLTYQTNIPSNVTVTFTQNSTQINVSTNYIFSSQPLGYTTITLSPCMQFNQSLQIIDFYGVTIPYTLVSLQKIQFNSKTNKTILQSITNPTESCIVNSQIKLQTFQDSSFNYQIAEQFFQPSVGCLGLCTSCYIANRSYCTACSDPYLLFQGSCQLICPLSYFAQSQQCNLCPTDCSQCINSASCLQCTNGKILSTDKKSCVSQDQCVAPEFIQNNSCKTCQKPCLQCGQQGKCLQCSNLTYLVEGQCQMTCPSNFELIGNICTKQTISQLILGMFLLLPCTYSYTAILIILIILKLTLKQRISLVMSNLTFASILLFGSLAFISYQNIVLWIQKPTAISCVIAFLPLVTLIAQFGFNIWISIIHRSVLRFAGFKTYSIMYLPSFLLSYHCLSLVKVSRPSDLENEDVVIKYLKMYAVVCKINLHVNLPIFGLLVYQTVMDQNADLLSQDTCFLLIVSAIWMQLALFYPPEDNIIQVYILENKTVQSLDALKLAKNSISLHMIQNYRAKKGINKQNSLVDIEIAAVSRSAVFEPSKVVQEISPEKQISDFGRIKANYKAAKLMSYSQTSSDFSVTQDQIVPDTNETDQIRFERKSFELPEKMTKKRSLFSKVNNRQ